MKKWLLKRFRPLLEEMFYAELRYKIVKAVQKLETKIKISDLPEDEIADLIIEVIGGGEIKPEHRRLLHEILVNLIYSRKH